MSFPDRILVTGAAGIVGTALRPLLRKAAKEIVLSDIAPIDELGLGERYLQCDLQDLETLTGAASGVDAILHLGGAVGATLDFDTILGANIIGTRNVFEAARLNGIKRVVFASSHHAVGYTPRGEAIDHLAPLRPNSDYGVSKAYGEAVGSYYADNFDMEALSIRIGYVGDDLSKERRLRTWISPRDLLQLVEIGFTYPGLRHEIVYGVSESPEPAFFDNENAHRLGYRPQDRSVDRLTDPSVLDQVPDLNSIEEGVVGGGFASANFAGDVAKVLGRK